MTRDWDGSVISGVTGLERSVALRILETRGDPRLRIVLWNGEEVRLSDEPPLARIVFRDRRVLPYLALHPELGLGDAYASGRLEVEGDLVTALKLFLGRPERRGLVARAHDALRLWRRRSHSLRRARSNIHSHYDLGNDFYSLWLDQRMAYTCAYFPTPTASLEEAQLAKMEHVSRKVWLRPGDHVVEAGCGWGSLALHMARHHGVTVTAYNISSEQVRYARDQAQRQGLAERVEFREDDYRNITGRYDAFVSVGMLEHVGDENYAELGRVIDRCLEPHGRGLIHAIGRVQRRPMDPWIVKHIFPGAYSPKLEEMVGILSPHELAVVDVENLRLHYEKTLTHWLERFEKNAAEIERRFDSSFVRIFRLYLAGSIASFHVGNLQLWQVVFQRTRSNDLPWTRARLYAARG
ncbi:MAG TPA: cyclopropane-fatty-acyl-phospholipid synthase family protein [Myxococcota bacterium]|nr:cyclopropane-fatty-acyl-phospholipid synthase family protein [Myxococcota bacterium]